MPTRLGMITKPGSNLILSAPKIITRSTDLKEISIRSMQVLVGIYICYDTWNGQDIQASSRGW